MAKARRRPLKAANRIAKGHKGGGQFAKKGATAAKLVPATARAFQGSPVNTKKKLTKLETGELGEKIAAQHMSAMGHGVKKLNAKTNNFAVDMLAGNYLVEVKAGLISNSSSAQKWRATIGEPRNKQEVAWLRKATPAQKAKHNAKKMQDIIKRKERALDVVSQGLGRKLKARTVTMIINPDTRHVDVYEFKGYHLHIRWNNAQGKKGFVASYKY